MKKKSIKQMLDMAKENLGGTNDEAVGVEESSEGEPSVKAISAAERLGSALLSELGGVEGVTDDELVDAILREWVSNRGKAHSRVNRTELPNEELEDGTADYNSGELFEPFGENPRTPVPMRTGSRGSDPVDYSEMSSQQFNNLKKLLKKASADGRRIRL